MRRIFSLSLALVAGLSLMAQGTARSARPLIQVALLLDTSNSMDGLIGQAKSQLWTFVNQFAPLKRDGQVPELQVALYEYGKSSIPAGEAYIRQISPLTTDLDKISEQLFALRTQGGDEYCGAVIKAASEGLNWSSSTKDLKVIFIAGNEPFTQGKVDYRQACQQTSTKGIIINTIFCGSHPEGVETQWADGARLGGGSYMNIDQNRQAVHVPSPYDAEIEKLGVALNETYVAIGSKGRVAQENQMKQDANAQASAGSMAQRAQAKASSFYVNDSWDLVDAEKTGKKKLKEVDKKDLPKEMQSMNESEARTYLDKKAKERSELQAKIQKLSAEREKYVANKRKEMGEKGALTLDAAMVQALQSQAKAKGFASNPRP